ncbi:MAG: DUF1844 domain-containing protein [Limisphaerales bacterium]
MNDSTSTPDAGTAASREQMNSAMFAHLVMQHTNMALIFLGQMPHPQTGQMSQDLEHARYFIDQLEMLEVKTKGNLNKQEETILKQSLTNLRMAFVEAVNHPQAAPAPAPAEQAPAAPVTDEQETPVAEPELPGEKPPPAAETQSSKRFSKKYS